MCVYLIFLYCLLFVCSVFVSMDPVKVFDRIHLSSSNLLVPKERLVNTPSRKDGMSRDLEIDMRVTGCHYIQSAGILLKLPQVSY